MLCISKFSTLLTLNQITTWSRRVFRDLIRGLLLLQVSFCEIVSLFHAAEANPQEGHVPKHPIQILSKKSSNRVSDQLLNDLIRQRSLIAHTRKCKTLRVLEPLVWPNTSYHVRPTMRKMSHSWGHRCRHFEFTTDSPVKQCELGLSGGESATHI